MLVSYNIYIVRKFWSSERRGQTVQVIQDFLCVLSIFITLYGSLWIGCLFDDACFAANFGGL